MKKNKIQGSYVTISNGSRQQLHLLGYTNESDTQNKSFLPWDVLNAQ